MTATSHYRAPAAARKILGAAFGFFTLLEIPQIWNPGKGGPGLVVFSVFFVAALAALTIRSFRSGVEVTSDGVTCRTLIRTTRWPRSAVARFEARQGRYGMMGYRRLLLWMVLGEESDKQLGLVNWSPKAEESAARIVNDLNRALADSPP